MKVFHSGRHRDAVYQLLLEAIGCGPFDGGCVVFAQALQRLHGGEIWVVEGRSLSGRDGCAPQYAGPLAAQHAVVRLPDGRFMDANGVTDEAGILRRTAREAAWIASAELARPLAEGDLPEAPRDDALVARLAAALATPVYGKRLVMGRAP